jgi:hypothetical protein
MHAVEYLNMIVPASFAGIGQKIKLEMLIMILEINISTLYLILVLNCLRFPYTH